MPQILDELRVIDCDAHFTEPPDLWSSRVPATMKGRMPEQRTVDGTTAWYLDDDVWSGIGGNTIKAGREKVLGLNVIQPFDAIDPAAWDVKHRLALMDQMGIYAQVLYPNAVGFSSNHIFAIEDTAQRVAVLQIYNDWLMDVQEESQGRLFPQAMLPIWDMDFTVSEMNRLLDRGATGFTLSDKPELLDLPELPEPYFAPMWDLANDAGVAMNFHIGAGMRRERNAQPLASSNVFASSHWGMFGPQRRLAILATQAYMSNARIIVNFCMSDLFDRYPNLKIVSAESGIGWVPFILEALEFQLDQMVTDPVECSLQKRRPTEYFRDHLFVSFWFEHLGPMKLIEDIGVNNVLIETDVPHPTCLYPGTKEHFASVLGDLDPHVQRRVLQDNAVELYKLTLPAEA